MVGYLYLKRLRGRSAARLGSRWTGLGRLGIMADIKYRYFKWRMQRLRKRFDVYEGRGGRKWDDRVH